MKLMLYNFLGLFIWFFITSACSLQSKSDSGGVGGAVTKIKLNSIGFLPYQIKSASISGYCSNFEILDTNGNVVYSGTVIGPVSNPLTSEEIYIADFSELTNVGVYTLSVSNIGSSYSFRIDENIYYEPYRTAMLGMYLWRCGTNVSASYNGRSYSHSACHLKDAYLNYITNSKEKKDGTGGWHDAGDYNKYTVNAGITLGVLFMAWEHFASRISNISLDIPEKGNSIPDFLDEMIWEVKWLLKMQYPDGSGRISHKISTLNFGGFIMPENETTTRYYVPWGSAATADFVAMMAMASRILQPYNSTLASNCIEAAKKSYSFLTNNPSYTKADQSGFSTGEYETDDSDDRLWAAAEMWETLGDAVYLNDFEKRANSASAKIDKSFDWGNVKNLGMFTYLLSSRTGKNSTLFGTISNALISVANEIVSNSQSNPYRRPLGTSYFWGCNGTVARQTMILQIANKFSPDTNYINTALDALGYLFGRNYFCRSFVTGVGYNPPKNPHDRRSVASGSAWPGYLVGGGWPTETSWQDDSDRYDLNEIAINWNAALIYALAGFVTNQP